MRRVLGSLALAYVLGFALPVNAEYAPESIETLLPKETMGFVTVSHLDRLWEVLPELPLLQNWPDFSEYAQPDEKLIPENEEGESVQGPKHPLEYLGMARFGLDMGARIAGFKNGEDLLRTLGSEITLAGILNAKGLPQPVIFIYLSEGGASRVKDSLLEIEKSMRNLNKKGKGKKSENPISIEWNNNSTGSSKRFTLHVPGEEAYGAFLRDEEAGRDYLVLQPVVMPIADLGAGVFDRLERLGALSGEDRKGDTVSGNEEYQRALSVVNLAQGKFENTLRLYFDLDRISQHPLVKAKIAEEAPYIKDLNVGSLLMTLDLEEGIILNNYLVFKDNVVKDAKGGTYPFFRFFLSPPVIKSVIEGFATQVLKNSSDEEAKAFLGQGSPIESMARMVDMGIKDVDFSVSHLVLPKGDAIQMHFAWGLEQLTVDEIGVVETDSSNPSSQSQ